MTALYGSVDGSALIGKFLSYLSVVVLAGTLASCGFFGEAPDKTLNWSAQRLYDSAKTALNGGDYETAIDYFEKLESRFPFGALAQQAQLEVAYAYYKFEEPSSAIAAADRFIKLYPSHPSVDYAYYLRGLVAFNRGKGFITSIIQRYIPADESQLDPASLREAFGYFEELVDRFPDSIYANDAKQRMVYLRNTLGQHEVNVANYYMERAAYVAAVNRAKHVVEQYQRTPAVADALVVMAKAYKIMGIDDLAEDALRVLELNFPQHPGIAEVQRLVLTQ